MTVSEEVSKNEVYIEEKRAFFNLSLSDNQNEASSNEDANISVLVSAKDETEVRLVFT